jgi:Na+/H+-dicarboxylate symporter
MRKLVGEASEIMIQVTRFVLEFTPIGTFGLIAALVGGYGFEQLLPLFNFVVALYAACAFHIVVVYGGLLMAHGLNPLKFFQWCRARHAGGVRGVEQLAALPVSLRQRHPQPGRGQGLRGLRGARRHHQDGWLRAIYPRWRRCSSRNTPASNCRCRST